MDEANNFARQVTSNDSIIKFVEQQLPKLAAQHLEASGLNYLGIEAAIADRMGVFSLSETSLSPPMWAHYAKNYEGFILEISSSHEFFNRLPYMKLQPVSYEIRILSHFMAGDESDLFLRKARDWDYEHEWRSFRILGSADEVTPSGNHLFRLPADAILGVVLGERASAELTALASHEAKLKRWRLSQVTADKKQKALGIVPLG